MALEPAFIGTGEGGYRDGKHFYIDPEARKRHLACFGGTGSGKSTLLKGIIASDIAAGHGVTVVDPHGQLVEDLLANHIPNRRLRDVIYVKASDPERSVAVNLLDARRRDQPGLVVSNALGIFHTLHRDSWGPRMDDIFRNALFALIEQPHPVSLVALPPLLT